MACSASCFLFPVLGKGERQRGWGQGMRGEVGCGEKGAASGLPWGVAQGGGAGQLGADCKSGAGDSSVPAGLFWGRSCRCKLRSPQLAPMGGSCREANCVSQYKLFPTGRVSCPPMDRW